MKKVLQVSSIGLDKGGVQSVIMGICRNIKDINFDILLFTKHTGCYEEEFHSFGGNIFRLPFYQYDGSNFLRKRLDYFIRFLRLFIGVYRILKKYGPYEAIHCHNFFESGICNFAARLAGVKVRISHSHTAEPNKKGNVLKRIYNYFLRLLIKYNSNVLIGCSEKSLNYLFGEDERAFVVNNAIDLKKFNRDKSDINISNEINFIHIGRFAPSKNQLFLLDVFNNIQHKIKNVKLRLIGYGDYKSKIEEKIAQLDLSEKVQIFPSNTNIENFLSKSDYMIFPSLYEGLGIVLLEAQVMGVKCFASSSCPHESNMGLCYYLDLIKGVNKWADYIIHFIEKDNRNNREYVKDDILKRYDIQEICKIYKKIYSNGEV